MKCKNCNKEIPDNSKFCPFCGEKIEFEIIKKEDLNNIPNYLNISPVTLVFLSIITCGLYKFYWFYYNWCREEEKTNKKIMPFWRAVFSIFYVSNLFKNISENAKKLNYKNNTSYKFWSTFYIIFAILGSLSSGLMNNTENIEFLLLGLLLWPISFLTIVSIFRMQKIVNYINSNNKSIQKNQKVFIGEKVFIAIGIVLFIFSIYNIGIFFKSFYISQPNEQYYLEQQQIKIEQGNKLSSLSNLEEEQEDGYFFKKIECEKFKDNILYEIKEYNQKQVPEKRTVNNGAIENFMCYEEKELIDLFYSQKINSCLYVESRKTICKSLMSYASGEYYITYDTYYLKDILNNEDLIFDDSGVNFIQKIHRSQEFNSDEDIRKIINKYK